MDSELQIPNSCVGLSFSIAGGRRDNKKSKQLLLHILVVHILSPLDIFISLLLMLTWNMIHIDIACIGAVLCSLLLACSLIYLLSEFDKLTPKEISNELTKQPTHSKKYD